MNLSFNRKGGTRILGVDYGLVRRIEETEKLLLLLAIGKNVCLEKIFRITNKTFFYKSFVKTSKRNVEID